MKDRDELQGSGMPPASRVDCYASCYTTAQPPFPPLFSAALPQRKVGTQLCYRFSEKHETPLGKPVVSNVGRLRS